MQKIISWFSFASGRWIPEVQQTPAEQNISKGDNDDSEDKEDDKVEDDKNEKFNGDSEVKLIQRWFHYNFWQKQILYDIH